MKKIVLILMAMAVIFLLSFAVFAQSSPPPTDKAGVYVIQKGETLWWLEGYHRGDPKQWRRIVDDNLFLKEPGRIFTRGEKTIALIKPGEQLKGLVELGILPQEVLVSGFQIPESSVGSIWYLLLGLAIAAALYGIYRLYRIFSDPATSGQPVIRGGLSADRPRDIETRFQRIAESRPGADSRDNVPQRIGPIEEGFLSGYGRVQYRDRSEMRRLNREPAYRARFRFHDGNEEDLFFLQRCANDVVLYNTRYLGFAFSSAHQVVPEPQVQSGPRSPLRVATLGEHPVVAVTRIKVKGLEIAIPEGGILHVTGDKITITVSHACDITIGQVKKAKKAKVVRSIAV